MKHKVKVPHNRIEDGGVLTEATNMASSANQQDDGSGSRVSQPPSPSNPIHNTAHPAPPPGASNHMKISDKHECWVVFVHLETFTMSNDPTRHLTQLGKDG